MLVLGWTQRHIVGFRDDSNRHKGHIGPSKGTLDPPKGTAAFGKGPLTTLYYQLTNILTSSAVGYWPNAKILSLLWIWFLSAWAAQNLTLLLIAYHSLIEQTLQQTSLLSSRNKLLCFVHTVNWEYHPSIFFRKGRRRSFVSTNIPATNSISMSINSTSS